MPRLYSIILLILLLAAGLTNYDRPLNFAFVVLGTTAVVTILNFYRLRSLPDSERSYWFLVLPGVFVLGFLGTLATISSAAIKLVLAAAGAGVFYHFNRSFPKRPAFLDEEFFTLTAAILILVAIWGLNFFFTPAWWITSLLIVVFFFPILGETFKKLGVPRPFFWALLNVLILVELTMSVLYWPVNILTAAVVVFAAFYLEYVFVALYYARRLTKKHIYFHLGLIFFVVLGSFLSSKWSA